MSKTFKYILDFVGNNGQLVNAINQSERKISELGKEAAGTQGKLGGMLGGAAKQFLAIGSFAAITAGATKLVTNIIDVRKEFEKYEAVLTNSLGSHQKASEAMKMLQGFASSTPFALTELTGSFVKLTNYGLKPTIEDMRRYGDLASSVGKGFDQLAEAAADAVTGEFERLKEFGIKASKEGDKVTFTFKEQKTTVANTAEEIKKYITGLGDLQGVSGSMAAISETLGGKISNLGDAWDGLMNSMGAKSSGVMVSVIEFLSTATNKLTGLFNGVESADSRGSGIIKSILGNMPQDTAQAKEKVKKELDELKTWLYDFQISLSKEQGKSDISTLFFKKEHNDRINSLTREIGAYTFAIDNLQITYDDQLKTEKEAADKKAKLAAELNAQRSSVEGINIQIKEYNDQLAKTNASDINSTAIIGEKIQALERQKAAIAAIASDPISFRTDKFAPLPTARVTGKLEVSSGEKDKFDITPKLNVEDIKKNMPVYQAAVDDMQMGQDAMIAKQQAVQDAFQSGFAEIGQSVVNGLGLASDGIEGFIGGMIGTAIKLISMFLAQSIAASIAGATESGAATGPAAIFTTPAFIATAIAGVLGAFAAIPAFADGGIVSGPTMGLMGEYPGASSNPEVIAPLSKLKGLIGGNSTGSANITLQPSIVYSGDQFRIFLNRVENNVNKRT